MIVLHYFNRQLVTDCVGSGCHAYKVVNCIALLLGYPHMLNKAAREVYMYYRLADSPTGAPEWFRRPRRRRE